MKIKIKFSDFWDGFNYKDNYYTQMLSKRFEVELSDDPDFLIYSCDGKNYLNYKCVRIFYTAENKRPNYNECDYSISFDYNTYNGKNIRWPYFVSASNLNKLLEKNSIENIISEKKKFSCFIVSNPNAIERIKFFNLLSKYKRVDSAGRHLNNIGDNIPNDFQEKLNFIKQYKFIIAFENSSYPGYTTEKIVHPILVDTIPIYWGNPIVNQDFNSKSFINVHEYNKYEDVVHEIIRIDNVENLYVKYLQEPFLINNLIPYRFTQDYLLDFFEYIFKQKDKIKPIASKKRYVFYSYKFIRKKFAEFKQKIKK